VRLEELSANTLGIAGPLGMRGLILVGALHDALRRLSALMAGVCIEGIARLNLAG
jgi:hypothetical protein